MTGHTLDTIMENFMPINELFYYSFIFQQYSFRRECGLQSALRTQNTTFIKEQMINIVRYCFLFNKIPVE